MRILALLLAAWPVFAATTVNGTINLPNGQPATGTAYIDLTTSCVAPGGVIVSNGTQIASITAGALSVSLVPNDTCVPGPNYYRVRYNIAGWQPGTEYWSVPTSPSTTTIAAVRTNSTTVAAMAAIGVGLLTGGVSKGDLIGYNGNAFERIPAGTDGYFLKRDNGQASGFAWSVGSSSTTGGACPSGQYTLSIDTAAAPTCSAVAWSQLSGTPSFLSTLTDHSIWVGTGSTMVNRTLPICTDLAKALHYDTATHLFSCDTIAPAWGSITSVPSTFTPSAHASSHQHSGADEVATATPGANAIPKAGAGGTLGAGWIPTLNQNTSGNAGTATALAADGANCSSGSAPLGVDASGAAQGCFDVGTQTEIDAKVSFTTSGSDPVGACNASSVHFNSTSDSFWVCNDGTWSPQLQYFKNTGVPTTCTSGYAGAIYVRTTNGAVYACDGSNYQLVGGAAITSTTVSYSATPTFTRSTSIQHFKLTLTGNVTSSTLASASAGDILTFEVCQDGTGGRTIVWPTGFGKIGQISLTASKCSQQTVKWDGSAAIPLGPMTSDDPGLCIAGSSSGCTNVVTSSTGSGTVTLPAGTYTVVGRDTTDTLTNKTLTAPVVAAISNTGTLTLPTSTDTLVGRATTDTLTNKTLTDPNLGAASSALTVEIANAGSTGTTVKKLAKLTGAPSTAVLLSTSDTNGIIGIVISGAGTTGNAKIARSGTALCAFDGATTAGQYVVASATTAGACHAQAYPSTSGQQAVGIVLETIGSAGDAKVAVQGSESRIASGGSSAWYAQLYCRGQLNSGETGYCGADGLNTTEAAGKLYMPVSGTLRNLRVINHSYNNVSITCTARVNGVDSSVTITIANDTVAGTVTSDTTHTVSVSAGDTYTLKCVNGAGSSTFISQQFTVN